MEDQLAVIVARPTPFEFKPSATAVVVVDMQNDFGSRGGMFDRAGIDIAEIQAIVPNIRAVLGAARASGVLVVYLKMAFRPDLADSGYPSRRRGSSTPRSMLARRSPPPPASPRAPSSGTRGVQTSSPV